MDKNINKIAHEVIENWIADWLPEYGDCPGYKEFSELENEIILMFAKNNYLATDAREIANSIVCSFEQELAGEALTPRTILYLFCDLYEVIENAGK